MGSTDREPTGRAGRRQAIVEQAGGRVIGIWYAFGEYDIASIAEFADNVSCTNDVVASAAGGALKAGKTTALLTVEEGLEALKNAKGAPYQPPSD